MQTNNRNRSRKPSLTKELVGVDVPRLVRASLARGRRYQFAGYPSGIKINHVAFRGHPEDDGGLPGVSVSWWGGLRRSRMFYPCRNQEEFWAMDIFKNAFDCPNANVDLPDTAAQDSASKSNNPAVSG